MGTRMKKIGWFDMLVYRLFHWRWNPILKNRPDLREWMISSLKAFDVLDEGSPVKITVSIAPKDD
jgi:hypothetical protein